MGQTKPRTSPTTRRLRPRRPTSRGALTVSAGSIDNSSAQSNAAGGGLIAVFGKGDNTATANITPTVNAYVGANRNVNVTGTITVSAQESPEGDANTKGTSGGGISVGGSASSSNINPTVHGYIGTASIVHGGSVNVSATALPQVAANLPNYNIVSANPTIDTLQVNNNGLNTGDVIAYDNGADVATQTSDAPIAGLVGVQFTVPPGSNQATPTYRNYGVISVDCRNNIALGPARRSRGAMSE